MRLLLFDVDGTLLHSHGAGRATLVHALETIFGTAGPVDSYHLAGKTDPRIIHDLMTAARIPASEIDLNLPAIYREMADHGRDIFPQKQLVPCAGIMPLLARLRETEGIMLGLLTGNISATTPLKLIAAGIAPEQFQLGAYGSDHIDRNALPAIAMNRASQLLQQPVTSAETIIIGDTPADIACARFSGARVLAVATGSYSAATLSQYQPDFLVDNLLDTNHIYQLLVES